MTVRSGLWALLALAFLAIVAGHIAGQPVLLSYVETESMEPTIGQGDGFVVLPAGIAGSVEEGDVVTFEAQSLNGGELTTHRIVGETEHGYVTKGDANPFVDQDGAEPPVTDGQIVAKAVTIDGAVLTVPRLGTAAVGVRTAIDRVQHRLAGSLGTSVILGTRGLGIAIFVAGLLILAVGSWRGQGRGRSHPDRSRTRTRKHEYSIGTLVLGFALLVGLTAIGTMGMSSNVHEYGVVSASFDSERPDVIPAGETRDHEMTLRSNGVIPMLSILEPGSEGIDAEPREHRIQRGGASDAKVWIAAPPETGYYMRSLVEYRYFAVLPAPLIVAMHAVHPWLAFGVISGVLAGALTAPVFLVTGAKSRIRVRERTRTGRFRGV